MQTAVGLSVAHNRDEALSRGAAEFPRWHLDGSAEVFFALDRQGGGSWMAANLQGQFVYLLNGGRKRHSHRPPYRMSRGRIPIEIARSGSLELWMKDFDPTDIEPFTVLSFDRDTISECVWDGSELHFERPQPPFIRASWTLYDEEAQQLRRDWMGSWLASDEEPSRDGQWKFHMSSFTERAEIDLMVDRTFLKTVAVSQFCFDSGQLNHRYRDTQADSELQCTLG